MSVCLSACRSILCGGPSEDTIVTINLKFGMWTQNVSPASRFPDIIFILIIRGSLYTKPPLECCFECETETGVVRVQGRHMVSHIFKKSRRELSMDVAEHRSTLKNYQNAHYPFLKFIAKTGVAFPKRGFVFTGYLKRSQY